MYIKENVQIKKIAFSLPKEYTENLHGETLCTKIVLHCNDFSSIQIQVFEDSRQGDFHHRLLCNRRPHRKPTSLEYIFQQIYICTHSPCKHVYLQSHLHFFYLNISFIKCLIYNIYNNFYYNNLNIINKKKKLGSIQEI